MVTTALIVIVLLTVLNGFFSMSEMALVSAKRVRLQAAAEQNKSGAKSALSLMEDPTALLTSVQIGITLIGFLTGVYSGATLTDPLKETLSGQGLPDLYSEQTAFVIVVGAVTFLSLIFGELIPKRVALPHAEALATTVAPIMRVFARIMTPLVWVLTHSVNLVLRILPVSSAPQSAVTEDDVRALVAEGTLTGVFLASERRLVEGVLALADRKVGSIMIPRPA